MSGTAVAAKSFIGKKTFGHIGWCEIATDKDCGLHVYLPGWMWPSLALFCSWSV
jgi:hypothetical protein